MLPENYSCKFLPYGSLLRWTFLEFTDLPFDDLEELRVICKAGDSSVNSLILDHVDVFIYPESWFWPPGFLSRLAKCWLFYWLYFEIIRLDLGQVWSRTRIQGGGWLPDQAVYQKLGFPLRQVKNGHDKHREGDLNQIYSTYLEHTGGVTWCFTGTKTMKWVFKYH